MEPLYVQSPQNAVTLNEIHVCEVYLNLDVRSDIEGKSAQSWIMRGKGAFAGVHTAASKNNLV